MSGPLPLAIRLLGPFEVALGDRVLATGGPKQRAACAALALRANRLVPVSELIEALWGDDVDVDRRHSLQQHVSSLRKLFGEAGADDQLVIAADGPGYRMTVARTAVDVFTFDALRSGARAALTEGDPTQALALLDEALGLWRGEPLADFFDQEWFATQARALAEDRLVVTEEMVEVRLGLGQHRELVGELESLVAAEPYRERPWAQLMLALYRSERQADALAAFGRARTVLVEELGIEPGEALRTLEGRILAQDPTLLVAGEPSMGGGGQTVVVDGEHKAFVQLPDGQQVHLGSKPLVIGRAPACAARLNDSRVSRRHAIIEFADGRFVVRDLDSTNGTWVNDAPVSSSPLGHGDEISVGGVVVTFNLY